MLESVTVSVTVVEPAAVGVPVMAPVLELMERLAGSPVADHVYGVAPPVAATLAEYGLPATPTGRGDAVVIETGARTFNVNCLLAD